MANLQLLTRRKALAFGAAACLAPRGAWSQTFPTKPIRVLASAAPGGGTETSSRLVSDYLAGYLKSPVISEAKPGAGGMLGAGLVAKADPDGYTLLYCAASAVTVAPHLTADPPFNTLTDLAPINAIGQSPLALALSPKMGIRSLQDFVKAAATRDIMLGHAGIGTLAHLTIELLNNATGGRIRQVPYKGGAPAVVDVLGGHIDGTVSDMASLFPQLQAKELVGIAITSDRRFALVPDIPTIGEVLPGFTAPVWHGIYAPAKTPPAVIQQLSDAIQTIASNNELKAKLTPLGIEFRPFPQPGDFRAFVASEFNRWGKFIKENNIKEG